MAPGICNPMAAFTLLVEIGPMPDLEDLPDNLDELRVERHVTQATIWDVTMFFWPGLQVPPMPFPKDGCGYGTGKEIMRSGK